MSLTTKIAQIEERSAAARKTGSLKQMSDDNLKSLLKAMQTNYQNMLNDLEGLRKFAEEWKPILIARKEVSKDSVTTLKKIVKELNSRASISPKYCLKVESDGLEKSLCTSTIDVTNFDDDPKCLSCILNQPYNSLYKCEINSCGALGQFPNRIIKTTGSSPELLIVCNPCWNTLRHQPGYVTLYEYQRQVRNQLQAQSQVQTAHNAQNVQNAQNASNVDPQAQMNSAVNNNGGSNPNSS